jgi:hypothetical protein
MYIDLPWLQVPSLKLLKATIARRSPTRLALYAACFAAAVAFTPGRSTPFIYFQF